MGDRFLLKGIFDDYGNCLDSSAIKLRASGVAGPRKNGLRYHLTSSVNFTPDGLSVREELAVDRPSSLLARWLERNNEAATEGRRDSEPQ